MTATPIVDSLLAGCSSLIICTMLYKALQPKKKVAIVLTILLSVYLGMLVYVSRYSPWIINLIPHAQHRQLFIMIGMPLGYMLYLLCAFTSSFKAKALGFCGVVLTITISEGLLASILMAFGIRADNALALSFAERFCIDLIALILYAIIAIGMYFLLTRKHYNFPGKVVGYSALIVFSGFILLFLIINTSSKSLKSISIIVPLALISFAVAMLSLHYITKYICIQQTEKEKLYWRGQMQTHDTLYSKSLQNKTEEIRKIQHDFKDNLFTLQMLIAGNTEESRMKANQLIEKLNAQIENSKIIFYTDNILVNTVLSAKILDAEALGISVDVKVDIPKELHGIDALDINILIINLLNNAIEACDKISFTEGKQIKFRLAKKGNFLIFKVSNPYDALEYGENGKIRTSKENAQAHGLGLSIIEEVTNRYRGQDSITTDDHIFTHAISLELRTEN